MARTSDQISKEIRGSLRVLDPDISTEPLTPERKIIDTFAETIAEAAVDTYVLQYQFDIDTKTGADLDKFVALFGFARQSGRQATGTVTFSRNIAADRDIFIPSGTQVVVPATSVTPTVIFQTTVSATLYIGTTDVDVPIQCTTVGTIGNISAHQITTMTVGNSDVSEVTNASPTSGGSAEESDAELRIRFKNTVFRNLAGTPDQYLALAISSRFAKKANVIGPVSRFIEYLQIAGGAATSLIPYSKYTYPFDFYLTDGDPVSETFYSPSSDYTFGSTAPPTLTVVNTTNLPNDKIVLLEHSYTSANSRNDPSTNVLNYVDIYVSGEDVTEATESTQFPSSSSNFVSGSGTFGVNKWLRSTGVAPTIGNRFQELLWQPVTELPSGITINGVTYVEGTDYWLVTDSSVFKGSRRSRNGIEWLASTVAGITTGSNFQITYDFDKLPLTLNELIDSHKQIASDALVHRATKRYFKLFLTVMYSPGFSAVTVNAAITTTLTDFLERQNFGAIIQFSDILEIAHEVPGVDNVRFTAFGESTGYGIQEVSSTGSDLGLPHSIDFALQDSDLPILYTIVPLARSQNTW